MGSGQLFRGLTRGQQGPRARVGVFGRHTFGSQLAQKGESLYKISALMGNSPDICRRDYAALIPEQMRDTVEFVRPEPPSPSPPETNQALLQELLRRLKSEQEKSSHMQVFRLVR